MTPFAIIVTVSLTKKQRNGFGFSGFSYIWFILKVQIKWSTEYNETRLGENWLPELILNGSPWILTDTS